MYMHGFFVSPPTLLYVVFELYVVLFFVCVSAYVQLFSKMFD